MGLTISKIKYVNYLKNYKIDNIQLEGDFNHINSELEDKEISLKRICKIQVILHN